MNPFVDVFFDVVLLTALAATVFYCLRISKQFDQMRADTKAFETLFQAMNIASARAEGAIRVLKETAADSAERLQDRLQKSQALADELEIMIHSGNSLAERLQKLAERSRKAADDTPTPTEAEWQEDPPLKVLTPAEKELLEALKNPKKKS